MGIGSTTIYRDRELDRDRDRDLYPDGESGAQALAVRVKRMLRALTP